MKIIRVFTLNTRSSTHTNFLLTYKLLKNKLDLSSYGFNSILALSHINVIDIYQMTGNIFKYVLMTSTQELETPLETLAND